MAETASTTKTHSGLTRRGFLGRAAIAAAAVAGLGAALRGLRAGRADAPAPLALDEDSIFTPRADQRDRVLGRK